jgi:hypothetical protein
VSFKVTSQIDTKNKYVILTESQAKSVLKDLSRYDDLIKIDSLNNEKIKGLEDVICLKDDTILSKDKIIKEKDDIISKSNGLRIGAFVGIQCLDDKTLHSYVSLLVQYRKINVSARYFVYSKDFNYSINVEYKIF